MDYCCYVARHRPEATFTQEIFHADLDTSDKLQVPDPEFGASCRQAGLAGARLCPTRSPAGLHVLDELITTIPRTSRKGVCGPPVRRLLAGAAARHSGA